MIARALQRAALVALVWVVGCCPPPPPAEIPAAPAPPVTPADPEPATPPSAVLAHPRPFAILWSFQVAPDRVADFEALCSLHAAQTLEHEGAFYRWELVRSSADPGRYWSQQVAASRDAFAFHLSPEARISMSHRPMFEPMSEGVESPLLLAGSGEELLAQRAPYGQVGPNSAELAKQGGEGEAWMQEEMQRARDHYAREKGLVEATFVSIERFIVPAERSAEFEAALARYASETLAADATAYRFDVIKDGKAEGYPAHGSEEEWYHLLAVFASEDAHRAHQSARAAAREELVGMGRHQVLDTGVQLIRQREPYAP